MNLRADRAEPSGLRSNRTMRDTRRSARSSPGRGVKDRPRVRPALAQGPSEGRAPARSAQARPPAPAPRSARCRPSDAVHRCSSVAPFRPLPEYPSLTDLWKTPARKRSGFPRARGRSARPTRRNSARLAGACRSMVATSLCCSSSHSPNRSRWSSKTRRTSSGSSATRTARISLGGIPCLRRIRRAAAAVIVTACGPSASTSTRDPPRTARSRAAPRSPSA
jgi:hypothetical protein